MMPSHAPPDRAFRSAAQRDSLSELYRSAQHLERATRPPNQAPQIVRPPQELELATEPHKRGSAIVSAVITRDGAASCGGSVVRYFAELQPSQKLDDLGPCISTCGLVRWLILKVSRQKAGGQRRNQISNRVTGGRVFEVQITGGVAAGSTTIRDRPRHGG